MHKKRFLKRDLFFLHLYVSTSDNWPQKKKKRLFIKMTRTYSGPVHDDKTTHMDHHSQYFVDLLIKVTITITEFSRFSGTLCVYVNRIEYFIATNKRRTMK